MTVHVNIGEAKTRLSELVAAAVRGEDVVLDKAGVPQVRLSPISAASDDAKAALAKRRQQALGMFATDFAGCDVSLQTLKGGRVDADDRYGREFADPD